MALNQGWMGSTPWEIYAYREDTRRLNKCKGQDKV